ncbi:hypothetical protein JXM83_01080 [Candidatus Woesearchaeota archaeon]|nr:hypothetical protein [Candidatus Woesearchaeota archaeon]
MKRTIFNFALIVFLLLVIARSSYADIMSVSIQGPTGNKFVKSGQSVSINSIVYTDGSPVLPNQVEFIYAGKSLFFTRCVQFTAENTDSLTQAYIGAANCSGSLGTVTYNDVSVENVVINLYTPSRSLLNTKTVNMFFDVLVPGIFKIEPLKNGDNLINGLRLFLNDSACSDSLCSGKCSGLASVQLFTGRSFSGTPINSSTLDGTCSQFVDILVGTLYGAEDISIKVYDKLGNEGKDIFFWNPQPELKNLVASGDFKYVNSLGERSQQGFMRGIKLSEIGSKSYLKDSLLLNVLARKGSNVVYGNEFKIFVDDISYTSYFSCARLNNVGNEELIGFYNCTGVLPNFYMSETETAVQNHVVTVRFLTDTGDESEQANENYIQAQANFKFEPELPNFTSLSVTSEVDNGNNYTLHLDASDNEGLLRVDVLESDSGSLVVSRKIGNQKVITDFLVPNIFYVYDGVKDFVVRVYDVVGNYVDKTISLEFDNKAPEPAGTYKIYASTRFDKNYDYVSSKVAIKGYIGFIVDDVNTIDVTFLDASGITINPIKSRTYTDLSKSVICNPQNGKHFCYISSELEFMVSDLSKASLNVSVRDSLGNVENVVLTPGYGLDNIDPVPKTLEVGFCSDIYGCFVGDVWPNPINVKILDEDSGFKMSYCFVSSDLGCSVYGLGVKVDVSSWTSKSNQRSVMRSCSVADNLWSCVGGFVASSVTENSSRVTFVSDTRDDSGNSYRGLDIIKGVSIGDSRVPEIKSFVIKPLGGGEGISGGDGIHVREGDYVRVEAEIVDLSPPTMKLDMTNLIPYDGVSSRKYYSVGGEPKYLVDGTCVLDSATTYSDGTPSRLWKCTWESNTGVTIPLVGDYAFKAGVFYNFTDSVGHYVSGINDTDVYLLAENDGNLLSLFVDLDNLVPGYINRRMVMFAPAKVNVPFVISKNSRSDLFVLSQRFTECTLLNNEDVNNSPVYIERSFDELFYLPYQFLQGAATDSMNPGYKTKFNMKTVLNENDNINEVAALNFSCKLAVYYGYSSGARKYMFKDPEVHDFNWSIDLKDSLFEPGMKIWEEIQSVNESGIVQGAWIFQTQKILSIAEKTCNLLENINTFLKPLNDLLALWTSINTALEGLKEIPLIGDFVAPVYEISNNAEGGVHKGIGSVTDFLQNNVFNLGVDEKGLATLSDNTDSAAKERHDTAFKPIRTICDLIKCSQCEKGDILTGGIQQSLSEGMADGLNDVARFGDILPPISAGTADWKNSFIASVSCACLPGIIERLQELRQIECNYMTCLQEKATMGLSVSSCRVDRAQFTCKYWSGELMALGPMRVVDAYINSIADSISQLAIDASPAAVISGLVMKVTCAVWNKETPSSAFIKGVDTVMCKVPAAVSNAKQTVDLFNSTLSSMFGGDGSYWSSYLDSITPWVVPDVDMCDPWVNSDFGDDEEEETEE